MIFTTFVHRLQLVAVNDEKGMAAFQFIQSVTGSIKHERVGY